jgi:hypothetical protein
LESSRIAVGPASRYHIEYIQGNKAIAEACFAYLLYVVTQELPITKRMFEAFSLLDYAAYYWPYHMSILESHAGAGTLLNLALQFFQLDSNAWRVWVAVGFGESRYRGFRLNLKELVTQQPWISIISDIVHPITYISAAGLATLLVILLRKHDADINTIPQTPSLASPLMPQLSMAAIGLLICFWLLVLTPTDLVGFMAPHYKPHLLLDSSVWFVASLMQVLKSMLKAATTVMPCKPRHGHAPQAWSDCYWMKAPTPKVGALETHYRLLVMRVP